MGARGPAPEPSRLRVLKGHKPLPQPRAVPGAGEMPDWLPPLAADMWARVVPELERLGVLGRIDLAVLEAFCVTYDRWRGCQSILQVEGLLHTGDKGATVRHPAAVLGSQLSAEMRQLGIQLGLTPASRLRMVLPDPAHDEEEAVFGRHRP